MGLADMFDFEQVVNEAEKMVIKEMEAQLPQEDWNDEEIIMDIATYALNHIKPAYSHTLMGKIYSQGLEISDYYEDVQKAVKKAIKKIKGEEKKKANSPEAVDPKLS
ncbi:late competence development ComFB family protein [Spirochaeta cellobiosiphila]|uniref:late competence development ComFB family protein n=1 Tax=Spirochaeta cellobiosiphila TaxID=504483 RepID=UPI00069D70BE|nr:late competence development ComFB family protein [Spirochaeta cellobiosiphila]